MRFSVPYFTVAASAALAGRAGAQGTQIAQRFGGGGPMPNCFGGTNLEVRFEAWDNLGRVYEDFDDAKLHGVYDGNKDAEPTTNWVRPL
ncbi:MAG: hypothetical protein IT207_07340 [Fimbriimonadaceae bacterium]|nr:hypothetical protein [Fimbriimonadaceae bacterium]